MHSRYKAIKQGKSSYNAPPPQTQQPPSNTIYSQTPLSAPVTYQSQSQPQPPPQTQPIIHHNGTSGLAHHQHHQQQQSTLYQSHSATPTNQNHLQYSNQPIQAPPQQPAAPYGYTNYSYPATQSYSAQSTGLMYTQYPPVEYGGASYTQHQQYPLDTMSHSVPATYNVYNEPQGLASSYQNAAYSTPHLIHVSSDNIPQLRPKKHVHFADHS
ncbi:hypothetical protein H4S07_003148 [Coemansia furcata]|uniref:Uncharacterized protein n=1 Tax=Coemansia furcata TaxID=417177 RepID=A0ACC1LHK6_9FUNG|nr:hypothetical protein H4S07_003148 [Coemansia furcata]